MSVRDIFTLNISIAPRLIRILYVVALVLIALGVVIGVARGIATMARPPAPRVALINPVPSSTETPPPQVVQPAQEPRAMSRRNLRGDGMSRRSGRAPILAGSFQIVRSLVAGLIALMLVRILAETGLAVLRMGEKAKA